MIRKNVRVTVEGKTYEVLVEFLEDDLRPEGEVGKIASPIASGPKPIVAPGEKAITAPLPGTVLSIDVKAGDSILANQELLLFEAMKMETTVFSPLDGVVAEVHVKPGDRVLEGQCLVTLK